jgi:putative ABC transport system ATP-binding protein
VQVTHSEENARYGSRILELRDGWLTRDEQVQTNATEVGAQ